MLIIQHCVDPSHPVKYLLIYYLLTSQLSSQHMSTEAHLRNFLQFLGGLCNERFFIAVFCFEKLDSKEGYSNNYPITAQDTDTSAERWTVLIYCFALDTFSKQNIA